MRSFPEARPFLPTDLPLVRRLAPHGTSFDSALLLTRGMYTLEGAMWSAVPLAELGTPTFVLRDGDEAYLAQLRHRHSSQHAHITFIAPDLNADDDTAWLVLLDTLTQAAGRRGALTVNAEVDETSRAFEILRHAGFAVYTRQEIWKRDPAPLHTDGADLLRPETDQDVFRIGALFASVVPRLVLQADDVGESGHGGLIYERNGNMLAYVLLQEGKSGIYIQALLHADAYPEAPAIVNAILARVPHADRLPVYWPVRRYQEWLNGSLSQAGFVAWMSQAVMVKHTASRVEHPVFKSHALEAVKRRTRALDCMNCDWLYSVEMEQREEYNLHGISHHRRYRKTQDRIASLSG